MELFVKDPDSFYKICNKVCYQHAPRTKIYVCGYNKRFMNKALSKALLRTTKLGNKSLKDTSAANKVSYNKQRNWGV